MSFECGDLCVDSDSILRQLAASRRMERQPAKFCESKRVGSKSREIKYVQVMPIEPLLISGLEVRVLRGSPTSLSPVS